MGPPRQWEGSMTDFVQGTLDLSGLWLAQGNSWAGGGGWEGLGLWGAGRQGSGGWVPEGREPYRCLLEGALGVGAATLVSDGGDLAAEQCALVLVRAAGGDVVDAGHHVVLGRESHDGHARGRGYHGEVGQQLADELELAEEVGLTHAGRLVHQEDELQALAELPQPPHAPPERLAQPLHFALGRVLAGRGGRGQPPRGPGGGLREEAEAEIAGRGRLLKGRPARNERQTPATKGQARPHRAGDGAAAPQLRGYPGAETLGGRARGGACAARGAGRRPGALPPLHLTLGTQSRLLRQPGGLGRKRRALFTPSPSLFSSLLLLSLPEAYKMFEGKGAVKKNLPLLSSPSRALCRSPLPSPASISASVSLLPLWFFSRDPAKG